MGHMTEYEKQLELRVAELESKIDEILAEQEKNCIPKYCMTIYMAMIYVKDMHLNIEYKINIDHEKIHANEITIRSNNDNFEADIQKLMEEEVYNDIIQVVRKKGFDINYFIANGTGLKIGDLPGEPNQVISALVINNLRKLSNTGRMFTKVELYYHLNKRFNRLYFLKRFILGR